SNMIVYAPTIKRVEQTVRFLEHNGVPAVAYHGQMESGERQRNQELWMSDEIPVLVGTIAFGLGINKPAVRAVIHLSLPKSIEQYYQEAGRAGRDGLPADCALLWQNKDAGLLAYFIDQLKDSNEKERAWQRYHGVRRFVEESRCRHRQICLHFGETPKWQACGMCDVCAELPGWFETQPSHPQTPAPRDTPSRPGTHVNPDLIEYLKEWRLEAARRNAMPAYIIMSDATLLDLCRRHPSTLNELLGVTGIGVRKAELYGKEIFAALAAFEGGARAKPRQKGA
ncbi:MAG: HRDC domain-containing protein, partial [Acidobacteriota bacterium]|nr:HRDC domain-containing protein [Acidobacteriota bacterium]